MKRLIKALLVAALALTMAACQGNNESKAKDKTAVEKREMLTISVENEKGEYVDLEVPKDPQRIVTLDYLAADQLVALGMEDRIVGMSKGSTPSHLKHLAENKDIVDLGTLKEVDMEALMSLQPDIIFTSGRLRAKYKEFSIIAPTVNSAFDYKLGSVESFKKLARRNAGIFGMEESVEEIIADTETRVAKLREKAEGKTAVIGIMIGGNLKTLGNKSKAAIIGNEIGFENLAVKVDSTHGNTSSYEYLLKLDPEYVFILDKDTAITAEGSSPAKQLMDNEIVHRTQAYKNGNIIYLTPDVWYLAEGGIKSMEIMLGDIEGAFEGK